MLKSVLVAMDNSTLVAYINKQGGTQSAEMCGILWKLMTWCHHYQITLRARHIPGCLNVMLTYCPSRTKSNQQNGHCFRRCSNRSVKSGFMYIYLPLVHIYPLNINWSGLTAYAYPATALLQKIRQCNCLIILIATDWPGMPWFWDLVQLSTEIPLQLPVATTLLKPKQPHNQVFHNNPQHLNLHT